MLALMQPLHTCTQPQLLSACMFPSSVPCIYNTVTDLFVSKVVVTMPSMGHALHRPCRSYTPKPSIDKLQPSGISTSRLEPAGTTTLVRCLLGQSRTGHPSTNSTAPGWVALVAAPVEAQNPARDAKAPPEIDSTKTFQPTRPLATRPGILVASSPLQSALIFAFGACYPQMQTTIF
jgi:hypothetical protein